jgi:hypothetical protein
MWSGGGGFFFPVFHLPCPKLFRSAHFVQNKSPPILREIHEFSHVKGFPFAAELFLMVK